MLNKTWTAVGIWLFIGLFVYALLSGLAAEGPLIVDAAVERNGALEIPRARDGHYYLNGQIDGHPVTFLVDTGATAVAISSALADELGLTGCRPTRARTANGQVSGCLANARELGFGHYRIERPELHVLPDLHGPALLGMNVLERFRVEQHQGIMRIAPP